MTNTKHTTGPWALDARATCHVVGVNNRSVCSAGGYSDNCSDGAYILENEANARLIAAAPELLEALENIIATDGNPCAITKCKAETKAIAAIAKAKGE